jgi:NAD(P)-dependent dehydrogenase (short-subunit alcohol dehydrogenase family)
MGKAIARQLAREGCDVAIGARSKARLRKSAAEIAGEIGRKIVPIVVNTLDAASIKRFIGGGGGESGCVSYPSQLCGPSRRHDTGRHGHHQR